MGEINALILQNLRQTMNQWNRVKDVSITVLTRTIKNLGGMEKVKMTIKDLGEKCQERDIECDECPYEKECSKLPFILENISPYGLLGILERVV